MSPKQDQYQRITDQIVAALEAGTVPWRKPWTSNGMPRNLQSNRAYRGINAFLLALAPYSSPYWTTFKAAKKAGGTVRKGEKGTTVVFWKVIRGERENTETGETEATAFPMLRHYTVFNLEQTDGLEVPKGRDEDREDREHSPIESAEAIVAGMPNPPTIALGGDRAYYNPSADHVQIPPAETFESGESFYGAHFHELTHATGAESRLNRGDIASANGGFGSHEYGQEELVAEMGAAFLRGEAGILAPELEQSAAYIASWLRTIKEDHKLVVTAAQRAQKAADYILAVEYPDRENGAENG